MSDSEELSGKRVALGAVGALFLVVAVFAIAAWAMTPDRPPGLEGRQQPYEAPAAQRREPARIEKEQAAGTGQAQLKQLRRTPLPDFLRQLEAVFGPFEQRSTKGEPAADTYVARWRGWTAKVTAYGDVVASLHLAGPERTGVRPMRATYVALKKHFGYWGIPTEDAKRFDGLFAEGDPLHVCTQFPCSRFFDVFADAPSVEVVTDLRKDGSMAVQADWRGTVRRATSQ